MTTANQLSLLAALSGLLVIGAVSKTPQGLYSDPAWQLESMQQYMEGISPSINHTVNPLPQDLSTNVTSWGTWWPPGTQLLVYPLARHLLPLGTVVRILTATALFIGAIGWARWIALFDLPSALQTSIVFLFPWIRYSSNPLFLYSPEILLFATAPWFLLAVWTITYRWWMRDRFEPWQWFFTAFLGLALGLRYWLKYSGVLLSLGLVTFLAWKAFHPVDEEGHRRPVPASAWIKVCVLIVFLAIPMALISAANLHFGHTMNGATATAGWYWHWESLLAMLANPALTLADSDAVLRYFLLNPHHPLVHHEIVIRLIGLPGGLLLWAILLSRRSWKGPDQLAVTALSCCLVLLGIIWTFSHSADFAARHMSSAGMAMLPLALEQGLRCWRPVPGGRTRRFLLAGGFLYVLIPLVYGYLSVFGKIIRTPEDYVLGPAHVYNPTFATTDVDAVRRRLLADFNSAHDIWYLTDPMTALDLPGREIVRHADFEDGGILKMEHFTTRLPLRIKALLPEHFETNGKGEIIRTSFAGAGPWRRQAVEGSDFILWTATLRPVE